MKLEGVCGGILEGVEVGAEGRFLKVRGGPGNGGARL